MHSDPAFHNQQELSLLALVRMRPLATVIGVRDGRALITHTPVLAHVDNDQPCLRFHLANTNPVCEAINAASHGLLVFTGPDAYISPDWYDQPDAVPTWNYLSCEAEGPVKVLPDEAKATLLDDLAERFETKLAPKPAWTRDKMADGKFEAMAAAVTAFELAPDRLEGVRKLSQNKSRHARTSAGQALALSGGDGAIAAMMMNDKTK